MPYFSNASNYDLSTAKPSVFEPDYAWYEGMGDAVINAPLNMARRLGQGAYLMGGGLLSYSSNVFDGETAEWLERESDASFAVVDSLQNQLNDSYAEAAGWGSKIVQNVGEVVGGVALTGGFGYGSVYGATEAAKEVSSGKDLTTSYLLGGVRGGAITLGALTPAAVGATTAERVGSGALINLTTGVATRAAEKQILQQRGYQNEADQLTVFDGYAMLADAIMGAGFGYLTRPQKDAAEAVSKLKKVDDESPEPLRTGEEVKNHRDNMRESVVAELEGREPTIKPLSEKSDIQRYADLPGTEGGRKIDVDMARKLDADYVMGKKEAFEVQEFAGKVADDAYLHRLENPDPTKQPTVEAMAGGAGSGKSTALDNAGVDLSQANVVLDATLKTYSSAKSKIEAALANGHDFQVNYVLADIKSAWERALLRAEKSGRAVPAEVFLATHTGALSTVKKLAKEFDGSESVFFRFFDNRGGVNDVKQIGFDELSKIDNNVSIKELEDIANELRSSGKISDRTHQKSVGKTTSVKDARTKGGAEGVSGEISKGDTQRPEESGGAGPSPDVVLGDGRTYAQAKAEADALIVKEQTIAKRAQAILGCLLTGA